MLAKKIVNIEVVGTCNLRCPSCPVGNYGDNRWSGNTKGVMEPELFLKIMQKVRTDFNPLETCIALYSWGEPLIHPKIGKLVEIAKSTGFKVNLSSNLNYIRHLPDALAAGVDEIVVSLSGMHADTYETTHRGGNVENLIANLRELARLRSLLTSPPPPVFVNFHLYRHNLGRDLKEITELCRELDFTVLTNIAFFMPIEKMIGIAEGKIDARPPATVANLFIVPIEEQLRISAHLPPSSHCDLRDNRLDIDIDGSVKLCCSVFEKSWNVAESYLETSFSEIQRRRFASNLCKSCISRGIDKIYTQNAVLSAWQTHANKVFIEQEEKLIYMDGVLDMPSNSVYKTLPNVAFLQCSKFFNSIRISVSAQSSCLLENINFSDKRLLSAVISSPPLSDENAPRNFDIQLLLSENRFIADLLITFNFTGYQPFTITLGNIAEAAKRTSGRLFTKFEEMTQGDSFRRMLDIGGRARSGILNADQFRRKEVVVLDILQDTGVDVVCDAHHMSTALKPNYFDIVFSQYVFEHLVMPWKVAIEMNRVMRIGAVGFIDTHQTVGMHDMPWDYYRYSDSAWKGLFNKHTGFEILGTELGDTQYIIPFVYQERHSQVEKTGGFEYSSVLFRKIAETTLDWPLNAADVTADIYPE